jgi:hypothetical protein
MVPYCVPEGECMATTVAGKTGSSDASTTLPFIEEVVTPCEYIPDMQTNRAAVSNTIDLDMLKNLRV